MLVDLAVPLLPVVPLARGQTQPQQKTAHGDAGLDRPPVHEVHDLVAAVMGNPDALQGSPSSFFSCTYSCITSARTSFFCCSFPSRAAIVRSLTSWPALRRLPLCSKAPAPLSKNSFCQR